MEHSPLAQARSTRFFQRSLRLPLLAVLGVVMALFTSPLAAQPGSQRGRPTEPAAPGGDQLPPPSPQAPAGEPPAPATEQPSDEPSNERSTPTGSQPASQPGVQPVPRPAPSSQSRAPSPATGLVSVQRLAKRLAIITIREEIDRTTAVSVRRRLADAARWNADAIVFELDTPGGELGSVLEISDLIKQSPTRTIAWINTKAYSGGAVIAMACDELIASGTASIGDAKPVMISPTGARGVPKDLEGKILQPLLDDLVESAHRRNQSANRWVYDEQILQAMALDDARLWLVRDRQTGELYAIRESEVSRLFPSEPLDQPPLLPGLTGPRSAASDPGVPSSLNQREARDPRSGPRGAARQGRSAGSTQEDKIATGESAGRVMPASPTAERVPNLGEALSTLTRRPNFSREDPARYDFIGKLHDANGPVVLNADWLAALGIATNLDASGRLEPIRSREELGTYFNSTNVRVLNVNWSEHTVRFLTAPVVRGVLIVVFLLGLFFEMTHPGTLIAGLIATGALVLLLAPPLVIGLAAWWEVAAIILGIAFVLLELLVIPGFGVFGISGVVLLMVGLVASFLPSGGGSGGSGELTQAIATVLLSIATAIGGMFLLGKYLGSIPILNRMILKDPEPAGEDMLLAMGVDTSLPSVGQEGVATTPLRPAGHAIFGERIFDVVAELGYVAQGARVRVVNANEYRIGVEAVSDDDVAAQSERVDGSATELGRESQTPAGGFGTEVASADAGDRPETISQPRTPGAIGEPNADDRNVSGPNSDGPSNR
ncbi:MAG: ATP-dependent Clp protease proteolytic subunit [Planctomycetota bacterium]|nr:ATP-dependent Clp protease proteolytic subunit [Planctomycetota bacterium]